MKKKIAIIVSVLCVGVVGSVATFKVVSKPKQKETIQTVEVATVKKQEVVTTIDAKGTVSFKEKNSVYAKNSGKVNSIPVKEGDYVEKGAVLIQYDKSSLDTLERQLEEAKLSLKSAKLGLDALMIPTDESQLKQLEAQISQTQKSINDLENNIKQNEKDIEKAKKDLEGGELLYSQGAISQTEYNNYKTALTNLENQKLSLQNNLDATKKQLDANNSQYQSAKNKTQDANTKNRIESQKVAIEQANLRVEQLTKDIAKFEKQSISPISGTIVKIHVADGENVTEGKLVAEVGDLNNLVITAYIPEYDMTGVKEGESVKIKSESVDGEFEGKITKVYPLAETKTIGGSEKSVVKVEISMPSGTGLKAGYTTDLTITTKVENDAIVIPIMSYMTENGGGEYVFVVKQDGTLEKRNIKVKSFKNSIASVDGLKEGEQVVSSPTDNMTDGMQINPIDAGTKNANNQQSTTTAGE